MNSLTSIIEHFSTLDEDSILGINIKVHTKTAIDFVEALELVGLQKNLIDKLKYISYEHPFRFTDLKV